MSLLQQEVDVARHSSVDKEDELRLQRGAFDLTKTELEVRCGECVGRCGTVWGSAVEVLGGDANDKLKL